MNEANLLLIGQKLKQIRKKKKMTLKEVAERMECSSPFLSMLENGRSGISLSKLQQLLAVYGMTMADLVENNSFSDRVVTLAEAVSLGNGRDAEGTTALLLVRNPHEKLIEPVLFRVPPGATIGPMQHAGEEFCYVIEGQFDVTLIDPDTGMREMYHLNAGDTIYHASTTPHIWYNPSPNREGVFIGAVTPPSF
ncbi:helix-turn-helix domain-containing protein [Papillibacter cinnamivorans]|uniref:Transcriptional regulator, XRE family with cupin sensor n=1 Tax=Papillibacter cinnamivorans DSM 12816 TaxID=1122930 RepID=A0A1W2CF61_9FIRM|nr:XRE family transcriptional regulator [Papillibacter cinnamivorans]SMC83288.1 transcriptional regulator, XRE family with cupin sensor [Papillibacter cinnamivorans DSM 12816]